MATIEDLDKESISQMSREELENLLLDVRLSRRTPTNRPKKKKVVKSVKTPKIDVDNMTDEAALELLKKLEGML